MKRLFPLMLVLGLLGLRHAKRVNEHGTATATTTA